MWCDNCLLVFPLRSGGIALLVLIALYQLAGGIFLFYYGSLFYFVTYEPEIYGGIAIAIALVMIIAIVGFSRSSFMIIRTAFFLIPIVVIIAAVRASFMIFDMNYRDDRIQWECDNGGQQWNQTVIDDGMTFTNETASGTLLPDKFCDMGVHRTYITFVFCLLVDFILLCYAWFLDWRMLARIRHAYALIRRDSLNPYA